MHVVCKAGISPGQEPCLLKFPVLSQTVSSVKVGLSFGPKSEAKVIKSSSNLDSSELTEVKVQRSEKLSIRRF